MSVPAKRKWLPTEAYRLLVLAALAHARGARSKAQLAREVRANHYVITKVLGELVSAGHVSIDDTDDGYAIGLTDVGYAFHAAHSGTLSSLYGEQLALHYRYGRRPGWVRL